ncbi:TetR/AcrR family transcriptional regulator [Actinokineospora pegani]|uniref:TetR/AcrR family transcriptional regulator n=1 Tax=Actinokineospora pegani TaxID=2654637 RepID=UPI0012EA9A41|nr:TetR family transcriptional regulator [Actinokineospora pegani]
MARTAGRSPEETRRVLLGAAAEVFRDRGVSATLADVARGAGVSKGGLLYHFATKDDLVRALVQDMLDTFRADVTAAVDPDDTGPGRLTRAYVRVSLRAHDADEVRETAALIAQLAAIPEVAALAKSDARHWAATLAADGLPPTVLALVVSAADGASFAALWGGASHTLPAHDLERGLLRLTRDRDLWALLAPSQG